ncbi:heparan-alpha-glucosaminide N-acetyltransferase domain-containing protein [Sanguibacter sp. A247]|uniref:heparan-alpha-glucosaminide N-acetyltransferase domain-containing protein n=1 Tax=unclassified Sanguibacter TaxID=2645534 RepID=UPI003FD89A66
MTTSSDATASSAPTRRLPSLRILPDVRERWARLVRPPRIAGVDLARGLAIGGMVAAHVSGAPQLVLADPSTWAGVVHGRSSLLFALVAGVSLALMSRGVRSAAITDVRRMRLTLVGRGLVILVLGVLLELVGSPVAVILGFYSVLFIVVAPVVAWPTRRLLLVVVLLVAVAVPATTLAMLAGLLGGPTAQLVLFGTYSMPVWLAFALAGLVVGRGDLRSVRRAGTLVVAGVLLAAAGYGGAALLAPASNEDASSSSPSSSGSGSTYSEMPGEDVDLTGFMCVPLDGGAVSCWPDGDDALDAPGPGTSSGSVSEPSGSEPSGSEPSGSAGSEPSGSASSGSVSEPSVSEPSGSVSEPSGSGWGSASGDASLGWSASASTTWWRPPASFDGVTGADIVTALFSMEAHSGGLGEVIGSGGVTLVLLGLCLLAGRPRVLRLVLVPIAALGSMPLTVYSLHIVSFLVPALTEPAGLETWLLQVGPLTVAATAWALTIGKGPLERLTASLAARYAIRTSRASDA